MECLALEVCFNRADIGNTEEMCSQLFIYDQLLECRQSFARWRMNTYVYR